MTTRARTLATTLAVTTALSVGACGGTGSDGPTTQSVDDYASTQAAKSKSAGSSKSEAPSATSTTGDDDTGAPSSSDDSETSSPSATYSTAPNPLEPTDKAQVSAATAFVKKYLDAFNKAARKPSTVDTLDAYTSPECTSCTSMKENIIIGALKDKKRKLGGNLTSFEFTVARRTDDPQTVRIFGALRQARVPIQDRTGKTVGHTKKQDSNERAFFVKETSQGSRIVAIKESIE